jgi:hypothetical protein
MSSILEDFKKIPSNSIEFQTLELHCFVIQILSQILKYFNKDRCSLFNSLQIPILFGIFQAREGRLFIKLIEIYLKSF